MSIAIQYVVDWQASGYFHKNALPSDPFNLVGNDCADIYNDVIREALNGTNTLASASEYEGDYGLTGLKWNTGASAGTKALTLFYGITNPVGPVYGYQYTAVTTETVTGCVWYKTLEAGDDGINVNVALYRAGGTLVATSANQSTSAAAGWRQLSVSGAVTAGNTIHLRINRASASNDTNFVFAGAMIVSGSTAPTAYNSGNTSRYDNITAYVLRGRWKLGFQNPWESIAGVGDGSLLVNNRSRIFSPEYASGALYGQLSSDKRITIIGSDGVSETTLYTGWIDAVALATSAVHDPTAEIKFTDARRFLEDKILATAVLTGKTARQIAQNIIGFTRFPNNGTLTSETPAEAWEEVYSYALDQNMNESEGSALDALADTAGGALAKVYYTREAMFQWYYQREFNHLNTFDGSVGTDLTLNETFVDAEYVYGAMLINEARVAYRRRKAGSVTTTVLWDADETITLSAGEVEVIRAMYKDPSTGDAKSIGATDVTLSITSSGAGVTSVIDPDAQSATITLENTAGVSRNVTVLQVLGRKLTAFRSAEKSAEDSTSKTLYGDHVTLMDYLLPQSRAFAQNVADYLVARFANPMGEMLRVVVAEGSAVTDAQILETSIGRRVNVIDTPTAHDAWYVVVGEELAHEPGQVFATWQLERHNPYGFVLDDPLNGKLDYARFGYDGI